MIEGTESLKEATEQKDALVALIKSRGWSILREHLEVSIQGNTNQVILVPTGEQFTPTQMEFMKGEITAMRSLLALPATLLEIVEANIATKDGAQDDEDD